MMNGEISKFDNFIGRDEFAPFASKIIQLGEDQARYSERISSLEKVTKDLAEDVSEKFSVIQETLDDLVKVKTVTEWIHRGLYGMFGFLLMDIFNHFSDVINWLYTFLHHG